MASKTITQRTRCVFYWELTGLKGKGWRVLVMLSNVRSGPRGQVTGPRVKYRNSTAENLIS